MRKSGILMHLTSLPGPYGVGTMGKPAFDFVNFLKKAGQQYWQILPLTPTGYGDSPYQSCSAYAGNPYLIDLDQLIQEGLLLREEVEAVSWCDRETAVDYGKLYNHRGPVLRKAFARFEDGEEYRRFLEENKDWLPDYALYMSIKQEHSFAPWFQWEEPLKFRQESALDAARQRLEEEIRYNYFVQFQFAKQWKALRAYAAERGIAFIGDVPIYVPYDSVEVWTEPQYFQLDENLALTAVAGCPPDAFSADGQLWGNPLYRWDVMEQTGFGWWLRRMSAAGKLFDVVRLDHFRGFEAYWSVPAGELTAKGGQWVPGPGMNFVNALKEGLPHLSFIAEDLGFLTEGVLQLRDASGYPGMKVLGFAFDSREPSDYLPHTYPQNSVCYTGTHDNMTTRQWFDTAGREAVAYAKEYMALTEAEGCVWGTIRTAMASVSDLCVVQMQDYLELGGEARMNFPGTLGTNWTWRAAPGFATEALAAKIAALTRLYGRAPAEK